MRGLITQGEDLTKRSQRAKRRRLLESCRDGDLRLPIFMLHTDDLGSASAHKPLENVCIVPGTTGTGAQQGQPSHLSEGPTYPRAPFAFSFSVVSLARFLTEFFVTRFFCVSWAKLEVKMS